MNKLRRMLIFGDGKGGGGGGTKTAIGLKVKKTVSRYAVGSTVSTDDITVKAVYTDGTEGDVTASTTIDSTSVSTASAGVTYVGITFGDLSGKLPITICDIQAEDDNLLQIADGDFYADNIRVTVRDNIVYLNGKAYANSKGYLKLTNGLDYKGASINNAWKSETVDGITSGNTYSYALFVMSGSTPSGFVGSVRDSSNTSILNASNSPQTLASNPAFVQLYWGSGATFNNVAVGVKIVSGSTTPTKWTGKGEDKGIEFPIGNVNPSVPRSVSTKAWKSNLLSGTSYVVMQGIDYHDGYLYCGVSTTSGGSATNYVLAKFDVSTGELIGTSSTDHYLGHCNDVAYSAADGYLHCASMDDNGTIHRVDTELNYIDSYTIDLTDKYANFSGIGAVAYDASKEKFIYLLRGTNKKYAVYSKARVFESLKDVTAQTGTYGGILTDDKFIYQAVSGNTNYVYKYDWNFNLAEKLEVVITGEIETMTWYDGTLKINLSGGDIRTTAEAKNTTS